MNLRTFLLMVLLAVVAAATWVSVNRQQPDLGNPRDPGSGTLPGYYLNEAVITIGGADGTPLYQMHAQQIVHQPSDNSVLMTDVKFDYLEQQESAWELTAKQGQIVDDQQVVKLFGEVRMVNKNENSETPTVMTTETLDVLPESHVATTDKPVLITHGQYEMTGIGMAADLNQGQLKLESDIHGYFKP